MNIKMLNKILLFGLSISIFACAPLKRQGSSSFDNSASPYVREEKKEPAVKKEDSSKIVVKEEKVNIVDREDSEASQGKYCVIIGSFKVLENARNYKVDLIKESFIPVILKNEAGLYRIAVATYQQEKPAREKIATIRQSHPNHSDVWLLIKQ